MLARPRMKHTQAPADLARPVAAPRTHRLPRRTTRGRQPCLCCSGAAHLWGTRPTRREAGGGISVASPGQGCHRGKTCRGGQFRPVALAKNGEPLADARWTAQHRAEETQHPHPASGTPWRAAGRRQGAQHGIVHCQLDDLQPVERRPPATLLFKSNSTLPQSAKRARRDRARRYPAPALTYRNPGRPNARKVLWSLPSPDTSRREEWNAWQFFTG